MELVIYNMYLRVSTGVHQTNNGSLDALGHRHDIDRDKISVHARDIIFHVICFLRGPIARNVNVASFSRQVPLRMQRLLLSMSLATFVA